MRLSQDRIEGCREREWPESCCLPPREDPACPYRPDVLERGHLTELVLSIRIKRVGGRRVLLSPEGRNLVLPSSLEPSQHIVNAIGLAYRWHDRLLRSRGTILALARAEGVTEGAIRRLLPLTHLGPEVLKAALVGTLSPSLTLNDLLVASGRLDWRAQTRELGL